MELEHHVLSCPFTLQDLNPACGGRETSKARTGLGYVCQRFVRVGCCLPSFWSEHVLGGVRVWMFLLALLLL